MINSDIPEYLRDLSREERNLIVNLRTSSKDVQKEIKSILNEQQKQKKKK